MKHALEGYFIGTVGGESLGLPYEGLSSSRVRRLFLQQDRQQLFLHYGQEDTAATLKIPFCAHAETVIEHHDRHGFTSFDEHAVFIDDGQTSGDRHGAQNTGPLRPSR